MPQAGLPEEITTTPEPRALNASNASDVSDVLDGSEAMQGRSPALEALFWNVYDQLHMQLDLAALRALPEDQRRTELRPVLLRYVSAADPALTSEHRERLTQDLLDEFLGLGLLDRLFRDPSLGDILVNGAREVWVERRGKLEPTSLQFRNDDHLLQMIDRIVSRVGRRIDETMPMVDARLPDGSRINAIIPPLSLKGPALSVRRFSATPLRLENLLALAALTPEMAQLLQAVVQAKLNVVISGGTGSGKTTLLNILSSFIPNEDRIITIEDAAELRLQQRHVLSLESRPANIEGKGAISLRDLVRNALRMRPDRIVIGECRGPEALDMLQAMNSGHEGSLTTLHANGARDALIRLETLLLMAGFDIPLRALRRQITSALQLIVQVDRLQGGARRITSITEVVGMEGDVIVTQDIFVYEQRGLDDRGRAVGRFMTTGIRPRFAAQLESRGFPLPPHLFTQRVLAKA